MGIEIILGDICYPKSEAIIIPANTLGIMSNDVQKRIIKDSFKSVSKEIEHYITNNKIEIGDCFTTNAGRLKRRGLKKIYHLVIKRLQSDFTSIYIVESSLVKVFNKLIKDKVKSVSICGIGIDAGDLDKKSVARIIVERCNKYRKVLDIKIIDDNEEFIKECKEIANKLGIFNKEKKDVIVKPSSISVEQDVDAN